MMQVSCCLAFFDWHIFQLCISSHQSFLRSDRVDVAAAISRHHRHWHSVLDLPKSEFSTRGLNRLASLHEYIDFTNANLDPLTSGLGQGVQGEYAFLTCALRCT